MFKEYLEQYRGIITENNPDNGICFDGAVRPDVFFARERRLMFLLKETNGNNNNGERNDVLTDWDYMEWVRMQAEQAEPLYRSVFRNIAMWSRMFEVVNDEERELVVSEFMDENGLIIDKSLCASLKNIAIVNLKKSWGVEQTDWYKMQEYLESDNQRREILLHQVEILKPTIVLCGGTFDFAQSIFGNTECVKEAKGLDGQKNRYFEHDLTTFVECYHPSRPGWSRVDSFNYVKNIFKYFLAVDKRNQ